MGWTVNGTPAVLDTPSDDMDVLDMAQFQNNTFLIHALSDGGDIRGQCSLNSDTGSSYAERHQNEGAADTTTAPATRLFSGLGVGDEFWVVYLISSTQAADKPAVGHYINRNASGAASIVRRAEWATKYSSSNNLFRFDFANDQAGTFDTNSVAALFGTDGG